MIEWRKARASNPSGNCVELAELVGGTHVGMRHSHHPEGPILIFTRAEIAAFLDGARGGEFDDLGGPGTGRATPYAAAVCGSSMEITTAEIDALRAVLNEEMDSSAYAARVSDFTAEEIRDGALRAADDEAERKNRDLYRRALAAARSIGPGDARAARAAPDGEGADMTETQAVDIAGCPCVTCLTSRANRQQAAMISELRATLERVWQLCDKPGYVDPSEIAEALNGPTGRTPGTPVGGSRPSPR